MGRAVIYEVVTDAGDVVAETDTIVDARFAALTVLAEDRAVAGLRILGGDGDVVEVVWRTD